MFNAIRSTLGRGATKAYLGSTVMGRGSGFTPVGRGNDLTWRGALTSDALRLAGGGLNKMAGMSDTGLSALMGGAAGGAYGAFAEDTSVLGGAMMGAGLGMAGLGATRLGQRGISTYRGVRAGGSASRSQAAGLAFRAMGAESRSYIGNSLTRATNRFNGLGK